MAEPLLFQVVVYNINGDKNIYTLKKLLFDSLNIPVDKTGRMIARGPFVIGTFDQLEAQHWQKVLAKLNAEVKLVQQGNCPLHPERKSVGACEACGTSFCLACRRKVGPRVLCELCAVEYESEEQEPAKGAKKAVPLIIVVIAVVSIILFLIFKGKKPKEPQAQAPAVRATAPGPQPAQPELSQPQASQSTDQDQDSTLRIDEDVPAEDLTNITSKFYRLVNGVEEETRFFTEQDSAFNVALVLENTTIAHDFKAAFLGPDGKVLSIQDRKLKKGGKQVSFSLDKADIRHAYNSEYVFGYYMLQVVMDGKPLSQLPVVYNPSQSFWHSDMQGIPRIPEAGAADFKKIIENYDKPWVAIFYVENSGRTEQLLKTARILALNPMYNLRFIKMNALRHKAVMQQLKIETVPASAVFVGNTLVKRINGFTNLDDYVKAVGSGLAYHLKKQETQKEMP